MVLFIVYLYILYSNCIQVIVVIYIFLKNHIGFALLLFGLPLGISGLTSFWQPSFSLRLTTSSLGGHKAEAYSVVADDRHEVVAAIRTAAAPHINEPATPTEHEDLSRWRARRVGLHFRWILAVPIAAPFPNIAVHVIQTPGIGVKTALR